MNKARSIKQTMPDALPNFRNLGVTLRILLVSNCLALIIALILADNWDDVQQSMMHIATLLTPTLLAGLLLLWVMQPWLYRLAYWRGVLTINALAIMLTLLINYFLSRFHLSDDRGVTAFHAVRYILLSVLVCSIMLMHFRLRSQALSRALHDARLKVLSARIRPHFLFNSINAVLGIMRSEPEKAETALHDMADMFRMAMSDVRDLVTLRQEIELSRQYISLEQLRMGERLHVDWQIQDGLDDALIPPLLLQPLLENAVYHGIEPLLQGGSIVVALGRNGKELRLRVENACARDSAGDNSGSKMALQNIRERLTLMFDAGTSYKTETGQGYYRVEIILPYIEEQ